MKCVINGKEYEFKEGETILEVALRNNIYIPTLCYLKKSSTPTGKCEVCVVELKGGDLVKACSTKVEDGMEIFTETERCVEHRRGVLEKILSLGYHDCPTCAVPGSCELQDLVYRYGARSISFSQAKKEYVVKYITPFIRWDSSKCVQCGRCIQACFDIQVNNAIRVFEVDGEAKEVEDACEDITLCESKKFVEKLKSDFKEPILPAPDENFCVSCGECIQACPVGALSSSYEWIGPKKWEMKKVESTCGYCGVGCQINLYVKDNRVFLIEGADKAPNYGSLCVKGRFGFKFISSNDRLKVPLIKENGKFREASWEEALDLVAKRFGEIKGKYGSDSIGVFASARITNEENYLLQKFTRAVLGTNNIDHCARL